FDVGYGERAGGQRKGIAGPEPAELLRDERLREELHGLLERHDQIALRFREPAHALVIEQRAPLTPAPLVPALANAADQGEPTFVERPTGLQLQRAQIVRNLRDAAERFEGDDASDEERLTMSADRVRSGTTEFHRRAAGGAGQARH